MKTPARRLGRGLGAFLDFDPAGDDGEAFIEDAIGGSKSSVLQTSTTSGDTVPARAAPSPSRAPASVAQQPAAAAPPPAPRVTVPPPPPAEEPASDSPFFDDEIVADLSFVDDTLEAPAPPAPPPVAARVAVPDPQRAAPASPAPAQAASESGFLDDEVVTGIAFPEVDLE